MGNKEYIEREALAQSIENNPHLPVSRLIKEAPAADVAPIRKPTEQEKQNLKALFQDKEQYYKLSTLYDLAYEDDVNGNCDGKVDVGVVACLTSADVEPVRHGEWRDWDGWRGNYDQRIEDATCSECGYIHHTVRREYNDTSFQDILNKLSKYCPNCGAKMDGGNK